MGAFSSDTPRLLWLCTIVACLFFIVNSYQVSADSKIDTDLVFDNLDQSNIKSHDNHPRIERDLSSEEIDTSPPVEQENWLIGSVKRLKRSISNLFNKNEDRYNKPMAHHKKTNAHDNKKAQKNQSKARVLSRRKHRQTEGGQHEADEYDEEAEQSQGQKWTDDEDDLDVNSGEGSTGETTVPEVLQTEAPRVEYGHPKVYRFRITLGEPYHNDFNDRNSNAFRNLASRIKQSIEELYETIPGDQYVTVVSVGQIDSDAFKVIATIDLDSSGFYDKEVIRTTLFNQIDESRRIGNMIVLPENFYFSEFDAVDCDSNQLKCQSGECVPISARCNGIRDCNDNSDETGCPEAETDPTLIESNGYDGLHGSDARPFIIGQSETTTTTITETPLEGSGWENDCRGDDAVRCDDGSKIICSVQKCDGNIDCDDGGDEKNCPPTYPSECAVGEFKCDVSRCIPVTNVCNGNFDCSDRTDEHNCPPKCTADEHQCDNKCISRDQVCDKRPDCDDGSDETNCPPEPQPCRSGEFSCGGGTCIPDYLRCDGRPDCRNGNDELNCSPPACRPDEFDCGDDCIKLEFRCDGFDDCKNGQDEFGCETECGQDEFRCVPDRRCISNSQKCDGRIDCSDNSDESDCPPINPVCTSDQLRCSDGSCIELSQQCNGIRDCPSGSDEEGCPCRTDEFQCTDGRCIDYNLRCNRRNDCSDGSDEYNCPPITTTFAPETTTQFNCREGYFPCSSLTQCIRRNQVCDGRVDCYDLSDEANCLASTAELNLKTYPNSQEIKENIYKPDREVVFQCRDEGPLRAKVVWRRPNGQPLPPGSVDRNGRLEIPDIKVQDSGTYICIASGYPPGTPGAEVTVELLVSRWEPPPTLRTPTACELHQATCSNGDCIDKNKVCDGRFDCLDGSDENRCNANGCEPNEYQCNNKKCVLKTWRCDSDDDCGDGSDEIDCGTSPPGAICQYHQFSCHSNNQCIPKSYHCDVERDCIDGSDEVGCSKPVISKPPPPMVNLQQHDTLIITCTAVGIPTPEIVWRLNWGHIPPKCRTTSVNGVGELICEDIQSEDQGAYSCEAINIKGSTFAVPDTIVVVQKSSPCRPGYFNDDARSESECIKCFCFGHTTNCHSADLFIYQFQPPFDSLRLLGVRIDPSTGVVDIRDEPIFRGVIPQLTSLGPNGVFSTAPDNAELSQPDVIPYFAMPENYHGNQLKSYGGYLRYTIRHSNRGYPTPGPNIIISGNGYILLHQSRQSPMPNSNQNFEVRFFEGEWIKKSDREPENIASREEIMMALEDVDNILIKLQYNEGILNTSLTNIEMDSAAAPNSGLGAASFVEECICPVGYAGYSCEKCADGYVRQESGPWLGQCYKEPISCPPGKYFDGRDCQVCPCPLTNPSNQFGRTCHLSSNGEVICDCQPGYVGDRCQYCAPGYNGNPLIPGDSCRRTPPDVCHADGSTGLDSFGRCRCKDLTEGPTCDRCRPNTFHLSAKNRFGCIACFCMGITSNCTSSNWYREQVSNVFTNSRNEFKLIDNLNRESTIEQGIRLNQQSREIVYNNFPSSNVYYWSLPPRYLGNKITSYGGYLRYTLRHTPVPGGQSSRNSAADVEIVSKNQYNLLFFNRNQTYPTSGPQTFVVPLLEQYWQRFDGNNVDREHLLMALADLDAIYIKATYYTNTEEAALISVSLDIANERNTGQERALEVEQCLCPPGYAGLSCEDCDVGFTRNNEGIYLGLCEPCNCYGHSKHCDPDTGVCFECRDFTTGDNCEQCLPGYKGDPVNGIPCVYQGTPRPCNCDPRGSISNDCRNGRCDCKINVEGNNCDRCRSGAFGLSADNIDGCEFCFCSGVASECRESDLFFEQIPKPFTEDHGYTLTDQYHRVRITDKFDVNTFFTEISYNFLPSQRDRLFWSLPSIFTGNKIKSYGGKLEFIQRYTQRPEARYVPDQDVVITGNGITIYWSNPVELREEIANPVSISLHPSTNWFRVEPSSGLKPASREDILMVLANIDSILIRATQSSDTSTAYLSDVTLETAVSQYTGRAKATTVEVCQCPVGYRGSSCESCAPGYYKDFYYGLSRPLGSCLLCPCNNRSSSCEVGSDNRVVCHCLDGYYGERCEYEGAITTTLPPPGPEPPGPPTIDIKIIHHNISIHEVGSTVRYNCSATSRLAPRTIRLRWSKLDGELPPRAIDDGRGLLVITDLRVADSGSYVCQATDSFTIVSQTVNLNVGTPNDQSPILALSTSYVNVDEGQPIEVTCAARGIPSPDLRLVRLDNQPLNPLQRFENGIFRIDQSIKADEGEYQCIATNRAGTTSARFQVVVRTHPSEVIRVDIQPSHYTGEIGDTVMFRCVASQDTQSVRWSKQGGELPYNSREDRGMLTITNAGVDDSGTYICTAISYFGTRGSSRATVTIRESGEREYPSAKVSPERVTVSQGQSTEIHCTASGFPFPTVKWTKLGGELSSNMEQSGSTLYIRNAQIEDRGVYVCISTNIHGLGQASAMVEVTRGAEFPKIEIYPSNQQTVVAGNSAILQCRAIAGRPTPTITWARGNRLPFTPNIEQMSEGALRFMQITPSEEGEYICSATNEAGTVTGSASIIVHTPPRIEIVPDQDVIRKIVGEHLRLECHGTGNPQPNVVWSKYNYEQPKLYSLAEPSAGLAQTSAYQEFFSLTAEDGGLYICRAQSSAGTEEKRIQLVVDTLPSRGDITGQDATSGNPSGGGYKDSERPRPPFDTPQNEGRFSSPVGTRAELRCRISNHSGSRLRIQWIRTDNASLPRESYESSGTLYIENVQPSAAGEYQCLGIDHTGSIVVRLRTYLEVISPPRITLDPLKQVVQPGQHAYINCSATGQQPISISWSPVGRDLPASVYTRDGIIRFSNIQLQDAGRYRCTAVNSAGEADAVAEVIVEENYPKPGITADQKQQIAPVGSSVTLHCRATTRASSVRWIRENLPLPRQSQVNGEYLYIYNVQSEDQGRYYCEITTEAGTSSDYIDLQLSGRNKYKRNH